MGSPTTLGILSASTVSLGTSSAQSAAIGTANSLQAGFSEVVRVAATADCWVRIGSNPTAAANGVDSIFMPAGAVEYFDVPAGSKIAGVVASGTGALNVARMRKGV